MTANGLRGRCAAVRCTGTCAPLAQGPPNPVAAVRARLATSKPRHPASADEGSRRPVPAPLFGAWSFGPESDLSAVAKVRIPSDGAGDH